MKNFTQAALAARAIRKELKKGFPNTRFSVTSKSYSAGDSVTISWDDSVTSKEVGKIANKYQYGNFNGMVDTYEYDNTRSDIPQVRFVLFSRDNDKFDINN